jgi:aspartate kinase
MHARAIEIAGKFGTDIWVGSSFEEGATRLGTRITRAPHRMEELALTGIASSGGQAKLVLRGLPPGLASATTVVVALAEAGVSVDMISEAADPTGRVQMQVTVSEAQLEPAETVSRAALAQLGGESLEVQRGLTRVAMVGHGMHQRPGVYARAFRALLDAGVEIFAVSTSGISITVWVLAEKEDVALRALHSAFSLELAADGA